MEVLKETLVILAVLREVFVIAACASLCLAAGLYATNAVKRDPLERFWRHRRRP